MSQIAYLFDECLHPAFHEGLKRRQPEIRVEKIGISPAPPNGTLDPEVLIYAECEKLLLVTRDVNTMPTHILDHQAAGRHTWGVFYVTKPKAFQKVVLDLILHWSVGTAESQIDQKDYLPWK